jgi:cob(I)alamin adenosyltransferase
MSKGLVIVLTGDGKGKTTSALGMALRAAGQGMRVLIIQFIKGGVFYGELASLKEVEGIEIKPMGLGMLLGSKEDFEAHREKAQEAMAEGRRAISSGLYEMVVLDEILVALNLGLVEEKEVLELISSRPPHVHLVLTGRGATEAIVELADTVTEMVERKHHYRLMKVSVKGIEF